MEKKPFVTLEQVKEMAASYPTPFHLYDEKGIRENARKLKAAFAWKPNFHEYFAVKATPNPYIMDILKSEGIGADCSSYTELLMSDAVGLKGHDIMFYSNVTPAEDFKKAAELGAIINFDDVSLIDFYEEIGAPFLETMCCRYNPGGNFTLHNEIMDTPKDAKYGMTKEQMKEAFTKLKAHGVKHFGIHAFLASNTVALGYYPKLARILFELAVELSKEVGVHIAFVNLSGGVGIAYRPDQEPNDIMAIGAAVKEAYDTAHDRIIYDIYEEVVEVYILEVLDEDSVNESLCKKLSEQEVSKAPDNRASPIKLYASYDLRTKFFRRLWWRS